MPRGGNPTTSGLNYYRRHRGLSILIMYHQRGGNLTGGDLQLATRRGNSTSPALISNRGLTKLLSPSLRGGNPTAIGLLFNRGLSIFPSHHQRGGSPIDGGHRPLGDWEVPFPLSSPVPRGGNPTTAGLPVPRRLSWVLHQPAQRGRLPTAAGL
jgi:hypothetical protein